MRYVVLNVISKCQEPSKHGQKGQNVHKTANFSSSDECLPGLSKFPTVHCDAFCCDWGVMSVMPASGEL